MTLHSDANSENKIGFVPSGETGPDGTFTPATSAFLVTEPPPGNYIATFGSPEIAPAQQTDYIETEIDVFQGKYSNPQQSTFRITVERGENTFSPFEID